LQRSWEQITAVVAEVTFDAHHHDTGVSAGGRDDSPRDPIR
jgi:hypothetical protein